MAVSGSTGHGAYKKRVLCGCTCAKVRLYHEAFTLLRRPARDSMAPARDSLRAHSQTSFAEDDAAPDDDAGPDDDRDA